MEIPSWEARMIRQGLKVMVAVPTHDQTSAFFAYDLAQMMGFLGANFVGPNRQIHAISLAFATGTYIHTARQDLADLALQQGHDYVLWLDSDMRFPENTLLRLLAHNEDIVGINYSNRSVPPRFVAIKTISPPERLVTDSKSTGLEEVESVGFGVTLVRTPVLDRLQDQRPVFRYDWLPENGQHVGEDVYFCRLAREVGFTVNVDHDLSRECAHVGVFEFTVEHPLAMLEEEVEV